MRRVVLASDLDRTLIHPVRTLPAGLADEVQGVEIYEGRVITTASRTALDGLAVLASRDAFVPVTTRSRAQLQRVSDVWGLVADGWAVCANGATILRAGEEEPNWRAEVARRCSIGASLAEARRRFEQEVGSPGRTPWISSLRDCDGWFSYATLDLVAVPADIERRTAEAMAPLGWRAVLHGRKLYVLPVALCKGAAVAWLRDRLGVEHLIGAGDSALDIELVATADVGWVPADAELVRQDAVPVGARLTDGHHVRAGEYIVAAALRALNGE